MMELRNTGSTPRRTRHIARVDSAPGIAAPSGGPASADAAGASTMLGPPPALPTRAATASGTRVQGLMSARMTFTTHGR